VRESSWFRVSFHVQGIRIKYSVMLLEGPSRAKCHLAEIGRSRYLRASMKRITTATVPDGTARPGAVVPGFLALLTAAGVCLLYLSCTGKHLISDDWSLFAQIQTLGDVGRDFTRTWLGHSRCYYRPFATVSLAADHAFWDLAPLGFHMTNLMILVACAALASRLAHRLACVRRTTAGTVAFLVVLLHPAAVEPGVWICCRGTLLSGFFSLCACLFFLGYVQRGRPRTLVALLAAQVAALLSKEDALMLPAAALVLGVSLRRPMRALSAFVLMGMVVGIYFLLRIHLDIAFADAGHRALLAPAMWGRAAGHLLGHLALLWIPRLEAAPLLALTGTAACGVGTVLVFLLNGRLLLRPVGLRVALALVLSTVPALAAAIHLSHGARVLYQPLLFTSMLLGLGVAGMVERFRGPVRWVPAGLALAGMAALTLVNLHRWRDAGVLAATVAGELQRVHAETPPDEAYVFLDPPRFLQGVPVLDQATNSILEPPLVKRPRLLMSVFRDLAREVVNAGPDNEASRVPLRVVTWRDRPGALLHAPVPPFTSPVLATWKGEALKKWRAARTDSGCSLLSPDVGVSSLVVDHLEVEMNRSSYEGRGRLSVEGTPLDAHAVYALDLRAEATAAGDRDRCRIRIPIRDLGGMVRVDCIGLDLTGLEVGDIAAVQILRVLPTFDLEAEMIETSGRPGIVIRLGVDTTLPVRTFRVGFYSLRSPLMKKNIPAEAFRCSGKGILIHEIHLDRLDTLGIGPGMDIFLRVEAYSGPVSPWHLRARSRPVKLKR